MKDIYNSFLKKNLWFYILTGISIALIIASFVVPPLGIIDNSVLRAIGEIFGFAALGVILHCIDKGTDATLKHNNTEIDIHQHKKEEGSI